MSDLDDETRIVTITSARYRELLNAANVSQLQAERDAFKAEVGQLLERLEIKFFYDLQGNKVFAKGSDAWPDGIEARDCTIKMLEAQLARYKAALDDISVYPTQFVDEQGKGYSERMPYMEGWNACAKAFIEKMARLDEQTAEGGEGT